jgi:type II secretory pathway pseudopilin PulG
MPEQTMATRKHRRGEEGTLLVIIMVGVAIGSIALTVATQSWSTAVRRDKEQELIFRGNQYVTAILAYRKDHGGQFPLTLEDLYKPGPRRLRYIRQLYKDPIVEGGKWGLLYLMPGGQGVYDPMAAQKAQDKAKDSWSSGWNAPQPGALPPGVTPIGRGQNPGALPADVGTVLDGMASSIGAFPTVPVPGTGGVGQGGPLDEERVSEPPIGWPIIGVVSRASGKTAEKTFKVYRAHEQVNEWQFHVFDRGEPLQVPGTPGNQVPPPRFIGPGSGGTGKILGIGEYGPRIGIRQPMFPPQPGGRLINPKGTQQNP